MTIVRNVLLLVLAAAVLPVVAETRAVDRAAVTDAPSSPKRDVLHSSRRFSDVVPATGLVKKHAKTTQAVDFPLVKYGTSTGMSGFYDYQSNGRSPRYLWVTPDGTFKNFHVTMMTATDSTDTTAVAASRHVGYGFSGDGGATWQSTNDVAGGQQRLGFPCVTTTPGFLDANNKEVPIVTGHAGRDQTFVVVSYVGDQQGQTTFGGNVQAPAVSAGGRGRTIWPTAVPTKDGNIFVTATVSPASTTDPQAPIQITTLDTKSATFAKYKALGDSLLTLSSGGDEVTAVSPSGKIGIVWQEFSDNYGLWMSESTDNGATFSAPTEIVRPLVKSDAPLWDPTDGPDTLLFGGNLDLIYIGEQPHVVFDASWEGFYKSESIWHWTPATGPHEVMLQDSTFRFGATAFPATAAQPSMGPISYPTIGCSEDGSRLLIACQAVWAENAGSTTRGYFDGSETPQFFYNRIFGVTSTDGGVTWGMPAVINGMDNLNQGDTYETVDFSYPHLAPINKTEGDTTHFNLVYMVRRHPGMFAFTASGSTPGPINRVHLYYQKVNVGPNGRISGAPDIYPPVITLQSSAASNTQWSVTEAGLYDSGIDSIVMTENTNYSYTPPTFTSGQSQVTMNAHVTDPTKDAKFTFYVTDRRGFRAMDSVMYQGQASPDTKAPVVTLSNRTAQYAEWMLADASAGDVGLDRIDVEEQTNCEYSVASLTRCTPSVSAVLQARMADPTRDAKFVFTVRDCQGNSTKDSVSFTGVPPSGVHQIDIAVPSTVTLMQNYPNPFNPTTQISFAMPTRGTAMLNVYDVYGRQVATLANEQLDAGAYSVTFHGDNLPSGMYTYVLDVNGRHTARMMMMTK